MKTIVIADTIIRTGNLVDEHVVTPVQKQVVSQTGREAPYLVWGGVRDSLLTTWEEILDPIYAQAREDIDEPR